jgi:hypothetical protein
MKTRAYIEKLDRQIRLCLSSAAQSCPRDFVSDISKRRGWSPESIQYWLANPSKAPLNALAEIAGELGATYGIMEAMLGSLRPD